MKKIIILAAIIMSVMTGFAGCSDNEQSFTQKDYESDGTKIKEIHIDVRDREIEVSQSEDNQIHIYYSESKQEYYDISLSNENVLTMTAADNKEWADYIGDKPALENRKISLQIPDSLLTTLKLSTTNENIQLSALNTKDISLSANGGNISFDKINAENSISLTVKNGNINGSIIGGYDDYAMTCNIKKGDCNLPAEKKDGSKKLSVNANNGNVEIDFHN